MSKQDTSIRRDLAEVWLKLGDILQLNGAKSEAREYYRKATQTLEELSASIPADAGNSRDVSRSTPKD